MHSGAKTEILSPPPIPSITGSSPKKLKHARGKIHGFFLFSSFSPGSAHHHSALPNRRLKQPVIFLNCHSFSYLRLSRPWPAPGHQDGPSLLDPQGSHQPFYLANLTCVSRYISMFLLPPWTSYRSLDVHSFKLCTFFSQHVPPFLSSLLTL